MALKLLKLSALVLLTIYCNLARADSFFASYDTPQYNSEDDHIIPLVYVKNLEYYNHRQTDIYTPQITEWLSFEPNMIITAKESMADYYLVPKLIKSKIEQINYEQSRFSMSVGLELWSKGGILINKERQNRYIIIENNEDTQQIAKKLLVKLLKEAVGNFSLKVKNNQVF